MKRTMLSLQIAAVAFFMAAGYVGAQAALPQLTKFCEYKNGDIKSMGSGFSVLKRCPANSRSVVISGEQGPQGPTGPQGPKGDQGIAGTFDIQKIYTKVQGPFTTTVGVASTIAHGCDRGDMVIAGGFYTGSGALADWRTIKSTPRYTEPGDLVDTAQGWDTTMINEVASGEFFTMVRCYDLQ